MECAHRSLPGSVTVDGGKRNCFAHIMNHVWDPSKANCRIQYCTDYIKDCGRANPSDLMDNVGILVMGVTKHVPKIWWRWGTMDQDTGWTD